MREIITSWPWYDQVLVTIFFGAVIAMPYIVGRQLDRIIKLLEAINGREAVKEYDRQFPPL